MPYATHGAHEIRKPVVVKLVRIPGRQKPRRSFVLINTTGAAHGLTECRITPSSTMRLSSASASALSDNATRLGGRFTGAASPVFIICIATLVRPMSSLNLAKDSFIFHQ